MADLRAFNDFLPGKSTLEDIANCVQLPNMQHFKSAIGNSSVNKSRNNNNNSTTTTHKHSSNSIISTNSMYLRHYLSFTVGGRGNPLHAGEAEQLLSDPPTKVHREKMLGLLPLMHVQTNDTDNNEQINENYTTNLSSTIYTTTDNSNNNNSNNMFQTNYSISQPTDLFPQINESERFKAREVFQSNESRNNTDNNNHNNNNNVDNNLNGENAMDCSSNGAKRIRTSNSSARSSSVDSDDMQILAAHPVSPSTRSSRPLVKSPANVVEFKSIALNENCPISTNSNSSTEPSAPRYPSTIYSLHSYGQDAAFVISDDSYAQCLGVADGVGGWRSQGVDSGEVSRAIMKCAVTVVKQQSEHIQNKQLGSVEQLKTPKQLLAEAYHMMKQDSTIDAGSTTAAILLLANIPLPSLSILETNRALHSGSTSPSLASQTHEMMNLNSNPPPSNEHWLRAPRDDNTVIGGISPSYSNPESRDLGLGFVSNIETKEPQITKILTNKFTSEFSDDDNEHTQSNNINNQQELNRTTPHELHDQGTQNNISSTMIGLIKSTDEDITEFFPSRDQTENKHNFIITEISPEPVNTAASNKHSESSSRNNSIVNTDIINTRPKSHSEPVKQLDAMEIAQSNNLPTNNESEILSMSRERTTSNMVPVVCDGLSVDNSVDSDKVPDKTCNGFINTVPLEPILPYIRENPTECEVLPYKSSVNYYESISTSNLSNSHTNHSATNLVDLQMDTSSDNIPSSTVNGSAVTNKSSPADLANIHRDSTNGFDYSDCDLYLCSANLGDSGYVVLRQGRVIYRSEFQRNDRLVKQLGIIPDRFRGPNHCYCDDSPTDADEQVHAVNVNDIIVVASDGLFDNLIRPVNTIEVVPFMDGFLRIPKQVNSGFDYYVELEDRIESLFYRAQQQISVENPGLGLSTSPIIKKQLIERFRDILIAEAAEFMGGPSGKPDDLTVIVAQVNKAD